jgi:hypothetical protein
MDHLHKQEFASLLVDIPSDIVQARFHSCVGPGVNVWLLIHPITPAFCLSTHFLITLRTRLNFLHPTIAHLSQC